MSDEEITKVEVPAPTPSSPEATIAPEVAPPPTYDFGGVPTVIMRGGTVSLRQETEWAKHRAEADQRRAIDDEQRRTQGARQTAEGFEVSQQLSMGKMVNSLSPKLVLHYMNRDGSVYQDCESEITQIPDETNASKMITMFAMVCPRCVSRGRPQGLSQMLIRDSHRKFYIDDRKKGPQPLMDAWGMRKQIIVAGTVSCDDIIKCTSEGCDYRCRINNSEVWPA